MLVTTQGTAPGKNLALQSCPGKNLALQSCPGKNLSSEQLYHLNFPNT